ncbi:IclR family transcriptional regulator [Fusobacterium perfoetens]|uniref:IclR family transcriptional regulator n=1 Tax=Fusobacterium perfoetens TaxID=852 RepID=UPI000488B0F9|nr:IclR family transcriptional regulator [Fusobacterium perfoetens]MCI6152241.1 IclR family transcriptional regulator [Fusobacterium perfoetens]MDY3237487.1 IclR family transcriptional regulator [Fusobacterium perfoetens]
MNKSTLKTLEILEIIASSKKGMTISEISKELEIPRSSVDDIVKALLKKEYIYQESEENKRYILGNKILELSLSVKNKREIIDVVNPFLKKLNEEYNETIFLALKDGDYVLYVGKIESTKNIKITAVLGSKKSLYYTGLGKAILSTFTEKEIEEYIQRIKLVAKTKYTIIDPYKLKKDILEAKERGYSKDYREGDEDISCVAAPLFQDGKVIGAISIAGLYGNVSENEMKKRGEKIKEVANKISILLG